MDAAIDVPIVGERHRDFGSGLFRGQVPRDLFLRRDEDDEITLDDGLAGERITRVQILRRQSQRRAPACVALLDHHRAASAATLPPTRDININPCLVRGVDNQSAVPRLDYFILGLEVNLLCSDRTKPLDIVMLGVNLVAQQAQLVLGRRRVLREVIRD